MIPSTICVVVRHDTRGSMKFVENGPSLKKKFAYKFIGHQNAHPHPPELRKRFSHHGKTAPNASELQSVKWLNLNNTWFFPDHVCWGVGWEGAWY
jgi:hypothetical protein